MNMKVVFSSCRRLFLLVAFLAFSLSANAQDCSETVRQISKVFDLMAEKVSKTTTLEELDAIDFENCAEAVEVGDLSDRCLHYRLKQSDKTLLLDSFNRFIKTIENKLYDLGDGFLSRNEIVKLFEPMKMTFTKIVNDAVDLADFITGLDALSTQ